MSTSGMLEVAGFLMLLITTVANFAYHYGRQSALNDRVENAFNQIKKIWEWKDAHEKDSSEKRVQYERTFGEIRGEVSVTRNEYQRIIQTLELLMDKIDRMEKRLDAIHSESRGEDD